MKRAKKYTSEFKREAVRWMQNRGERTVLDVATSLGVRTSQLHQWRLDSASRREEVSVPKEEDVKKENERLRRRIRDLEEDREILKKAAAFFAKEHG